MKMLTVFDVRNGQNKQPRLAVPGTGVVLVRDQDNRYVPQRRGVVDQALAAEIDVEFRGWPLNEETIHRLGLFVQRHEGVAGAAEKLQQSDGTTMNHGLGSHR